MLQRRIGQKNAQPWNPRRHRIGNSATFKRTRQHNRPRRRLQQRFFRGCQRTHLPRRLNVLHHHSQRLPVAVLAFSQAHHGCLIGSVNAQMESANPLDGHDFAGCQAVNRCGHRIVR